MSTIARLNPYQVWEIDAMEGWLDDMASQGLIFTHTSGSHYYFREDEPQSIRHRLDVHEKDASSKTRHEEFRDFGWEHICYVDSCTDIYRAIREDAVELNTDEETLRSVMARSQRRLRNLLICGEIFTVTILLFLAVSIYRFGFFSLLLTRSLWDLLPIPLWLCIILLGDIRLWRSHRELKQRSLLERTYHTREREATRRREMRTRTVILAVLIAVQAGLLMLDNNVREAMEIVDTGYERYSLQDVLPEDYIDSNSYAMFYPRSLSGDYYFTQKTASGKHYYANISEVRWAWLARCYAQEQAKLATAEGLSVSGHDAAWFYVGTPTSQRRYADTPDTQNLILLQGNLVVEIEYTGSADLRAAALALS